MIWWKALSVTIHQKKRANRHRSALQFSQHDTQSASSSWMKRRVVSRLLQTTNIWHWVNVSRRQQKIHQSSGSHRDYQSLTNDLNVTFHSFSRSKIYEQRCCFCSLLLNLLRWLIRLINNRDSLFRSCLLNEFNSCSLFALSCDGKVWKELRSGVDRKFYHEGKDCFEA